MFEKLYEMLNNFGSEEVSEFFKEWHPAILGQFAAAIHKAKKKRCGYHPHYFREIESIYNEEKKLFDEYYVKKS